MTQKMFLLRFVVKSSGICSGLVGLDSVGSYRQVPQSRRGLSSLSSLLQCSIRSRASARDTNLEALRHSARSRLGDAHLAADLLHRCAAFSLRQRKGDLIFRKPLPLRGTSLLGVQSALRLQSARTSSSDQDRPACVTGSAIRNVPSWINSAISASENPASRNTSSLCSPARGG